MGRSEKTDVRTQDKTHQISVRVLLLRTENDLLTALHAGKCLTLFQETCTESWIKVTDCSVVRKKVRLLTGVS